MIELTRTSLDFDQAITLVPVDEHPEQFSVELDRGWSSLVGVHGGYMCAIAVRGAESLAPDRYVRTLTTSFLRTGQVGPATLSVREVRKGRSITTMVAELSQDDRLLTVSRLTLLADRAGVEWSAPAPLDLPPLADRPVDSSWLAMATDWFPPPAFVRLEPPTGGVSVDLTTHIHQPHPVLDDDEWLTAVFEIETSGGGLAVEHGRIAERDGTLVAESFQTRLTAKD